ncbi:MULTISPECIES: DUF6344 domain-containing protein [unclassified Streptomyces]|jgi:hypothetical protein|uniref:DUF6344 domain-containing protein n=1 Tax=Streptomyces TaxID=1883 RepID=UPI001CBD1EB7|nr:MULTISPECIES: DUF6344 domain-containing protein [unclassified Streptomyces]WPO72630.1 DUF6344 domain-containing protein [Streptomyces sp. KN37]
MTGNKPMKLWTTIVTAFLALFAALGFTTTATAATAVQETTNARNATECASPTAPFMALWTAAYERSLPPTMKQRIRAEAHGSSPSCRHLPPTDTEAEAEAPTHEPRLAAEP